MSRRCAGARGRRDRFMLDVGIGIAEIERSEHLLVQQIARRGRSMRRHGNETGNQHGCENVMTHV